MTNDQKSEPRSADAQEAQQSADVQTGQRLADAAQQAASRSAEAQQPADVQTQKAQLAEAAQLAEQARRRRKQARVMNTLNVPMRRVLGLPIPTPLGKRLMLAHIVGRKSGRLYRLPLSYVRDGDTLLTPGGGKWKLNLDPAKPVRLRIRGRDVQARPELVRDQDEVVRLLGVMEAANPASARFIPLPKGPDGKPEPQPLAQAIKYGFCIVRWHLDESTAAR